MSAQESTTQARILGPTDGEIAGSPEFRSDRFMIDGIHTERRLAVVEQTVAPGVLGAPVHIHAREDEYSYVIEGRLGVLLGDEEGGRFRHSRSGTAARSTSSRHRSSSNATA